MNAQPDWFRVALANIGDAVIVTDTQGRVISLNSAAQSLTGWSQEDATGKPLPAVLPIVDEQTRLPLEDPVAKVLASEVIVGGNGSRGGQERPCGLSVEIRLNGFDQPREDIATLATAGFDHG